MSDQQNRPAHEIHNAIAPSVLRQIVHETNGSPVQMLIILESVVTGALTFIVKIGGDETVLDVFMARVRERMAEIRLTDLDPKGNG